MSDLNQDIYFGADEAEKLVAYLIKRSDLWFQTMVSTAYLDKVQRSWQYYYGNYYSYNHTTSFGGESGELVNLPINHYGNIGQNMLTMVTATRPSFQARAINTDLKSQIQTNLANGLLEYYMRDKKLEKDLKDVVEYAIVLGTGYLKMEWNATSGKVYDMVEPTFRKTIDEMGNEIEELDEEGNPIIEQEGYPIYEGDVEFSVLSPYDVVFDTTRETTKMDWQLCRTFKNKYDIAAKYPEKREEILELQTKSEQSRFRMTMTPFDETVDVPVYEFYHRPTESLPKGRYVMYLSSDVILIDTVLPYRTLPLFRIAPGNIMGTPFGYSRMWDLMPLQESVNSLHSTIMTNNHTFGVQNIVTQRSNNLSYSEMSGGLNLIEVDEMSQAPQALQLTRTAPETFQYMQQLVHDMEVISGINSVARGNPDPKQNLRSGNALALIQAQALQFISGLQQSYIGLIEDVGTNLVRLLQDFASVPRVAQIVGKSNATYMQEFTGDDLNSITRVIVDAGNALAQTTAGKVEMAEQLMQMGAIKTPEEYISVINTGRLESMTESQNKQLLLIRAENERLVDAEKPVIAILTDDHSLHIREHQAVLADPDLRMDPDLVQRATQHLQEHMDILQNPALANTLIVMGQQPIQPQMPPGPPMGAPGQAPPADGAPIQPNEGTSDIMSNPQASDVSMMSQAGVGIPNPAQPPAPFTDIPQTGQELFNANIGNQPKV